ncbi:hypothetical protein D3C72_1396760 [compost metagenome]
MAVGGDGRRRWPPALVVIGLLAFLIPVWWLWRSAEKPKPVPATPAPVVRLPSASPLPETASGRPVLDWGAFANHPARPIAERATLLGAKEALLLFYGLRRTALDPDEFAAFFPDARRSDSAWTREQAAPERRRQLEASLAALKDAPILVRNREVRVGPYDARRGAFPVYRSADLRQTRTGMPRTVVMWDLSASGQADLRRINEAAAKRNRRYTNLTMAVELDNVGWRALEVDWLPWPAADAARVAIEFGHGEPLDDPEAIRQLGKGEQDYRTVTAYAIARPERTESRRVAMEGEVYLRKTLHMRASHLIVATPRGTVLGVYTAD